MASSVDVHQGVETGHLDLLARAAMGEDIADLADGDHRPAGGGQRVEQSRRRWRDRVVLAMAGADEGLRRLAEEGPGDHAADVERVGQLACHAADLVETVETEMLLHARRSA